MAALDVAGVESHRTIADGRAHARPAAVLLLLLVSTVWAVTDARLWHWYLIPVTLCGLLVVVDLADWLSGRRDLFDPQALIGVLGVHFFYLTPILHVVLDFWPVYIKPVDDWRSAFGAMAVVNLAGLCLYRVVVAVPHRSRPGRAQRVLNARWFVHSGQAAIIVGFAALIAVAAKFGGLGGYLSTAADNRAAFTGLGWLLLIGESFPLVAFVVVVVRHRRTLAAQTGVLVMTFGAFAVVQFLVGGLRGSRSNTVWPVLIGLIVVHLAVRPVSRRALAVMVAVFVAFMYGYGLYKATGSEVLRATNGTISVAELGQDTGRTLPAMLLSDLGRADVQAVVLHNQANDVAPLGYGITYVGAFGFMIPDSVRPEWMLTKVEVGTDMIAGEGAHASGLRSSRVYGLAGEATLNFGTPGAVVSFIALGLIVRSVNRRLTRVRDSRDPGAAAMFGFGLIAAVLVVSSDLDNILWFLVKMALPLTAVVLISRQTREREPMGAPG